jgi:hypothetical protein
MGEVVNLNKIRKAREKAQAKAQARENRASFGRTKGQRDLEKAEAEKAERSLDGAKRETDDE